MNLSNYFWYFKSALNSYDFVMKLLNMHYNKKTAIARTGGFDKKKLSKEDVKNIQRKRKSDLSMVQ